MKDTLIIKKSAKRNDMESKATVYARVRDGRRLDCTVSTMIEVNPNLWDNSKGHLKERIVIDKKDKVRIDGEANNLVTFINNEYAGKTIDNNQRTVTVPLNAISKAILQKYKDYPGPSLMPPKSILGEWER